MKINRYECDICGAQIENGREYQITIKYPVPKEVIRMDSYARHSRSSVKKELCEKCFNKRLKEFGEGEENDSGTENR